MNSTNEVAKLISCHFKTIHCLLLWRLHRPIYFQCFLFCFVSCCPCSPWIPHKWIVHPKMNQLLILVFSKPIRLLFIFERQMKIFLMKIERFLNWKSFQPNLWFKATIKRL